MLQEFCLDVAKVDLDVAYTCMLQAYVSTVFKCFICMFASISFGCCIWLQWFLNVLQAFLQVFQRLVLSVSSIFFCMLQLFHLDVSKVYQVLHIGCTWEAVAGADDVWAAWATSGRRGTTTGALPHEPDTLGARSLPVRAGIKSVFI